MLDMATPVNLLFVVLLFVAGFALLNEGMILVGFISTLALLTAVLGAAMLAMITVRANKTLSPAGFRVFLVLAFVIPLAIWALEVFNHIPEHQWLHVLGLAVIMLLFSLHLVPRLRRLYQSMGVMAQA
ncbi:MAG: hypothetical protein L3J67_13925 [Hyphomicrobiaceae bacterium]|nr:hypothetical protein [Hyphomicrobiaceae bacterium]